MFLLFFFCSPEIEKHCVYSIQYYHYVRRMVIVYVVHLSNDHRVRVCSRQNRELFIIYNIILFGSYKWGRLGYSVYYYVYITLYTTYIILYYSCMKNPNTCFFFCRRLCLVPHCRPDNKQSRVLCTDDDGFENTSLLTTKKQKQTHARNVPRETSKTVDKTLKKQNTHTHT